MSIDQSNVVVGQSSSDAVSDETLLDQEAEQAQQQVDVNVKPSVNLQTQSDCPFFASIIQYLQDGILPTSRDQANSILMQAPDFYIENDQLFHLARIRSKRLALIQPRYPQLCIPRAQRLLVMESYHNLSVYL
jgi:hypothetical protein